MLDLRVSERMGSMKSGFYIIGAIALPLLLAVNISNAEIPADPFMGDWKGVRVLADGQNQPFYAQVIALGGGNYHALLYDTLEERSTAFVSLQNTARDESILFDRTIGRGADNVLQITAHGLLIAASVWTGNVDTENFTGSFRGRENGSFSLERYERPSPTLGAKPAPGALVLFDGRNLKQWTDKKGKKSRWKLLDKEAVEVVPKTGSIITKKSFGDHRLHIEFRTPFMPTDRGQKRGNSGVYLLGRYEVQVLDSYGLEGRDNECGGIYKVSRPRVNACAPPTHWQTYDITFRAPRFDSKGKKTENARITVIHNGILIHEDVELPNFTGGSLAENEVHTAPLMLQEHGNPVQFRNIWVEEL